MHRVEREKTWNEIVNLNLKFPKKVWEMTLISASKCSYGFGRRILSCAKFSTSFSCRSNKASDEKLKDRQKELMARSLPKKRRLPGVKHVVLVKIVDIFKRNETYPKYSPISRPAYNPTPTQGWTNKIEILVPEIFRSMSTILHFKSVWNTFLVLEDLQCLLFE